MDLPEIDIEDNDTDPIMTKGMVELIINIAKESSGKLISRKTAKKIYEAVVQTMITETIRTGQFRMPAGFGQFMLKFYPAQKRKAFGKEIDIPARGYVRYREGNAIKEMLDREVSLNYRRKKPRPQPTSV